MKCMGSDAELLERWSGGDRTAGNQLFQRYFDSLYGFFETKIDRSDVEELVQTTLMGCVQGLGTFRQSSSFRTFLFAIARHKLYRYFRDRKRHGQHLDFNVSSVEEMGTGVHTHLGRAEDQRLLLQALCSLPLMQQIMLELFYWENMKGPQIAEILDIAVGTVSSRLTRARAALRERVHALAQNPRYQTLSVEDLDAWARGMHERRVSA